MGLRHRSLLILCSSFVRAGEAVLRPGLRLCRSAARKGPSRLAVALGLPLAPALPGHALTGPSTARHLGRSGRRRIPSDALEFALLVDNGPGDAGKLVGERDRQHVVVQPPLGSFDPGLEPVVFPSFLA